MEVKRASTAGFCMGVSLALHKLDTALRKNGQDGRPASRICTFGPIIHNPQVLRDYEEKGVACLNDPGEARSGDSVIIRAHGVPRGEEARLKACGATLGLMAGSYIERHRIRYTVPAGAPLLPLLSGIGVAIIYAWKYYFADATIVALMGPHWGNLVARFILVFFGLVIWPMVIRSFCGEQARQAA